MTRNDRLTSTSIPKVVAVALAKVTVARPHVIGRHRAQWLFDLATSETALQAERKLARKALQAAADSAGRNIATKANGDPITNRVYSKASNRRLVRWSQDRPSPVWQVAHRGLTASPFFVFFSKLFYGRRRGDHFINRLTPALFRLWS